MEVTCKERASKYESMFFFLHMGPTKHVSHVATEKWTPQYGSIHVVFQLGGSHGLASGFEPMIF